MIHAYIRKFNVMSTVKHFLKTKHGSKQSEPKNKSSHKEIVNGFKTKAQRALGEKGLLFHPTCSTKSQELMDNP